MDARKFLAIGTGVSLEIAGTDLVATVVRVRPGGASVLGSRTIADFAGRPAAEWGAEYAAFLRRLGAGHRAATVLLPRQEVIVRQVSLPGVADQDLGAAIQFQIDSLHPYGEEDVRFSWARIGHSQTVLVGIARRPAIDRYSQLFVEAGVKVASFTFSAAALYSALRIYSAPPADGLLAIAGDGELEIYGESPQRPLFSAVLDEPVERAVALAAAELRLPPEIQAAPLGGVLPKPVSAPEGYDLSREALAYATALAGACPWLALKANLLPPELRSTGSRMVFVPTFVLAAILLALAAALAAQPAYQQRRQLSRLHAEIDRIAPQATRAEALQRSIDRARNQVLLLDGFRRRTRADLDALGELTRLIEPPCWLNGLDIDRESVMLSGEAEQAEPLLKLIDSSPLFRNSEFTGPVGKSGSRETFRIRAQREGVAQ